MWACYYKKKLYDNFIKYFYVKLRSLAFHFRGPLYNRY